MDELDYRNDPKFSNRQCSVERLRALFIELQNPSLRALIGRRALLAPIRDLCDREG